MLTSVSPEPCLARCAFSPASASLAVMPGTRRKSSLAAARCGSIVLPAGPRVSGDESFDIHRGFAGQKFERLQPVHVVDPMFDAHLLLGDIFVQVLGGFANERLLLRVA